MKFTLTLVSLLPLLGAAASIENRAPEGEITELPQLDTSVVPQELFGSLGVEGEEDGDFSAEACPYFVCNGRCCRYNICCRNECCLPGTDFCGRNDGRCYKWT